MEHKIKITLAVVLSFLGIEGISLSDIDIAIKIVCEISVTVFTCIYIYRKSKSLKS